MIIECFSDNEWFLLPNSEGICRSMGNASGYGMGKGKGDGNGLGISLWFNEGVGFCFGVGSGGNSLAIENSECYGRGNGFGSSEVDE